MTENFKGGTRHVIYPWNQSKIANRKSSSPRIYLAQVNRKSKIENLKSIDQSKTEAEPRRPFEIVDCFFLISHRWQKYPGDWEVLYGTQAQNSSIDLCSSNNCFDVACCLESSSNYWLYFGVFPQRIWNWAATFVPKFN
jgi:hypothetical protein